MTEKEINKKINCYWKYLRSILTTLYGNDCVTLSQYNAISNKIDKICFKEYRNDKKKIQEIADGEI